jgi:hypothetical protein
MPFMVTSGREGHPGIRPSNASEPVTARPYGVGTDIDPKCPNGHSEFETRTQKPGSKSS